MARAGLEDSWDCAFANDFSPMKVRAYCANWGDDHFCLEDVNKLSVAALPGYADLAWASFPCQDLSLAGVGAGLGTQDHQTRSGAFWAFWKLIGALSLEDRAPSLIILENVCGALTANQGGEFGTICTAMVAEGYAVGAIVVDASLFVPHSRPRLFIIGVRQDFVLPVYLVSDRPTPAWHPPSMQKAVAKLPAEVLKQWFWLSVDVPVRCNSSLSHIIEDDPSDVVWHTPPETAGLIAKMSRINLAKLQRMKNQGGPVFATVYRRTRIGPDGRSAVMAELRDDGIAGCLRTPGGGSSRQFLVRVDGGTVRSRLLSSREAARLMGLSDLYRLPPRYNDAYHLMGDGVVVPVVKFLNKHILQPILAESPILAENEALMLAAAA